MDDLLGIGGTEDVAAADENVDAGSYEARRGLLLYAAVDFDEGVAAAVGDELSEAAYLWYGVLDELLSAEAWIDAHEQHHVDIADDVFERGDGRRGVQRDASLHAGGMDFLNGSVQVERGFLMYVHHHGAESCRLLYVALWTFNHEVNVERLLAYFGKGLEH